MVEPLPSVPAEAWTVPSPEALPSGLGDVEVVPVGLVGAVVGVVPGAVVGAAFAAPEVAGVLPGVVRALVAAGRGVPGVVRGAGAVLELELLGFGEGFGAGVLDGEGAGAGVAAGGGVLGAAPLPNAKPITVPGAGL